MAQPLEPPPLLGRPALRGRQRRRLLEMDRGVGRPAFEQGQVAEEDVHLGMLGGVRDRPLQRGADQSRLVGQERQLGEQRVRRGSSGCALTASASCRRQASKSRFSKLLIACSTSAMPREASSTSTAAVGPGVPEEMKMGPAQAAEDARTTPAATRRASRPTPPRPPPPRSGIARIVPPVPTVSPRPRPSVRLDPGGRDRAPRAARIGVVSPNLGRISRKLTAGLSCLTCISESFQFTLNRL